MKQNWVHIHPDKNNYMIQLKKLFPITIKTRRFDNYTRWIKIWLLDSKNMFFVILVLMRQLAFCKSIAQCP